MIINFLIIIQVNMNIVVSEYSSGFAHVTHLLCNAFAENEKINRVTYISDVNNQYVNSLNKDVNCELIFDVFKSDGIYKKGTLIWMLNRIYVALKNGLIRRKYIKANKPDVVLVQATLASIDRFFLSGIKRYSKVVLTVHDVVPPFKTISSNNSSLKKTYEIADKLVVHSQENKKELIEIFDILPEKISVVNLGIKNDYKEIAKEYAQNKVGINSEKMNLLFFGGIRENKGLDVLIKSIEGLNCRLVIAGGMPYGESFDYYQNLIDECDIDVVKYIEFVSDEFKEYLYASCDFVVLPYKWFLSQSGVLMECVSYRKPVIVSDVCSFKNFVNTYEIGYVCEPDNVDDLHRVIKEAINEKDRRKYVKNLTDAANENSYDISAERYCNLFEEILECL